MYTYVMIEIKLLFQFSFLKKKEKKKEVITYFVNIYADNYLQERRDYLHEPRENIGNIYIN